MIWLFLVWYLVMGVTALAIYQHEFGDPGNPFFLLLFWPLALFAFLVIATGEALLKLTK